ncbi:hypothetical protein B0H14DRAFT_3472347 [Mycena olivaceomarginata]|nr:hypothetical protein B0H14DRAFT_3472347 [Mycena olivaceomarginata]
MDPSLSASSKPDVAKELFREALKMYNARPELDPTKYSAEFAQCSSADDIMLALRKRVTGLKKFRDDRWVKDSCCIPHLFTSAVSEVPSTTTVSALPSTVITPASTTPPAPWLSSSSMVPSSTSISTPLDPLRLRSILQVLKTCFRRWSMTSACTESFNKYGYPSRSGIEHNGCCSNKPLTYPFELIRVWMAVETNLSATRPMPHASTY